MNANANGNDRQIVPKDQTLPANLPAGAKAFQAAVDGKLTQEVWGQILDAQIEKAKGGDRGAAKFLLEYAGGVASMRGATFVQENHQHSHYHEGASLEPEPSVNGEDAELSPDQYEHRRHLHAQRVSARISSRNGSPEKRGQTTVPTGGR